jgi:hypothetical protein
MVKSSMSKIEIKGAADGPVVSEGGRRPSALSTGHGGTNGARPAIGALGPGQRWSVGRKREVVLRLLRGESAQAEQCPPWECQRNAMGARCIAIAN